MSRPRSAADALESSSIHSRRSAAPGCTGSCVTSMIKSLVSAVVIRSSSRSRGPDFPLYRSQCPPAERHLAVISARVRQDAYAAALMTDAARLSRTVLPVHYGLLVETDAGMTTFTGQV